MIQLFYLVLKESEFLILFILYRVMYLFIKCTSKVNLFYIIHIGSQSFFFKFKIEKLHTRVYYAFKPRWFSDYTIDINNVYSYLLLFKKSFLKHYGTI